MIPREDRHCRYCGKPLQTALTGYWFFCPPEDPLQEVHTCRDKYQEEHAPDLAVTHLLKMRPTDEDNEGVSMADIHLPHGEKI